MQGNKENDVPINRPHWVSIVGGGLVEEDMLCVDIRRLQQRSRCSDVTCRDIIKTMSKYLRIDAPESFRATDKKMKDVAGATCLRLNGCTGCNRHVYLPDDKSKFCPRRKDDGMCETPRYDAHGKPHEVCMYACTHTHPHAHAPMHSCTHAPIHSL